MPNEPRIHDARVRASWRMHACLAGLCTGAQIFLFGTGIAMPLALNSAWIAAFAAAGTAAILGACSVSVCGAVSRAAHLLLVAVLLLGALFSLAALMNFAGQTLLKQSRPMQSALIALAAAILCALSGAAGISRLCFALRWVFVLIIGALALSSMPKGVPAGLFPLLGAGASRIGLSALCMLGGASPALMLMLPPPELAELNTAPPPKRFFVFRVLAGALAGCAFLFLSCVNTTYETIAQSSEWGARLHLIAGYRPHEGLLQMGLILLELSVLTLLSAAMLSAAQQALCRAIPRLARQHLGLWLLASLLLAMLGALIIFGYEIALTCAPLLILPAPVIWALQRKAAKKTC